jgi:aldehyde dehydrogenase (NAD+)
MTALRNYTRAIRATKGTALLGYRLQHVRPLSTASSKTINVAGQDISVPTGIFINNEFRKAIGGTTFGVENPVTGKEILQIEEGKEADVNEAVKTARATFRNGEWSSSDPVYRADLLRKVAELMERDK